MCLLGDCETQFVLCNPLRGFYSYGPDYLGQSRGHALTVRMTILQNISPTRACGRATSAGLYPLVSW